jgi:hypothetical protein
MTDSCTVTESMLIVAWSMANAVTAANPYAALSGSNTYVGDWANTTFKFPKRTEGEE